MSHKGNDVFLENLHEVLEERKEKEVYARCMAPYDAYDKEEVAWRLEHCYKPTQQEKPVAKNIILKRNASYDYWKEHQLSLLEDL